MASVDPVELVRIMRDAGFPNNSAIAIGLAVAWAESGLDDAARNAEGNEPESTDRGLWQINDHWHPEVTDECAYDRECSTLHALRISRNGRDWGPWVAHKNDSWKRYKEAAWLAIRVQDARDREDLLKDEVGHLRGQVMALESKIQAAKAALG